MAQIQIEGMDFFAYHGFYEEEQVIGNKYLLDIKFEVEAETAIETDSINDTVNYQEVYNLIKIEMAVKSKLLENVAGRIISQLKAAFPQIKNIELKISKLRPPVDGIVNKISIVVNG